MQDSTSGELGTRLRGLRLAKGLTQLQLATRAGVSTRTLISIEQGGGTRVATLDAIAGGLDVSLAELIATAPAERAEAGDAA